MESGGEGTPSGHQIDDLFRAQVHVFSQAHPFSKKPGVEASFSGVQEGEHNAVEIASTPGKCLEGGHGDRREGAPGGRSKSLGRCETNPQPCEAPRALRAGDKVDTIHRRRGMPPVSENVGNERREVRTVTQRAFSGPEPKNAFVGIVETDREILGRGIESQNTHRGIVSENVDPARAIGIDGKPDSPVVLRKECRKTISPFDEGQGFGAKVVGEAELFRLFRVIQAVQVYMHDGRSGRVDLSDGVTRAVDESAAEVSYEPPGKGRFSGTERTFEGDDIPGNRLPGDTPSQSLGLFGGSADDGQRTGPPVVKCRLR